MSDDDENELPTRRPANGWTVPCSGSRPASAASMAACAPMPASRPTRSKLLAERAKFASDLDKVSAKAKRLDDTSAEVARRLVVAMETVNEVLQAMPEVNVEIDGKKYRMACEDGQEAHLMELAERFNRTVIQLKGSFGEIGDNRLVVMAGIAVLDELAEAEDRIAALKQDIADLTTAGRN